MSVRPYQENIQVLGGVTVPSGVRPYQYYIQILGTPEIVSSPSDNSTENISAKNRTTLGVG